MGGNGWKRTEGGQTLIACEAPDPLKHRGLGGLWEGYLRVLF